MQVKIVNGVRQIQANSRDLKIMREAAGLFAFVFDNEPELGEFLEPDATTLTGHRAESVRPSEECRYANEWIAAAIASCEDDAEEDTAPAPKPDDVAKAAGQTT